MSDIEQFGWTVAFAQHINEEERAMQLRPARVVAEHRRGVVVNDGTDERFILSKGRWFHGSRQNRPTVGDWTLVGETNPDFHRLIQRKNLLQRAGKRLDQPQSIAANIDFVFPVFSCNEDFTESRLERYLALAEIAGAEAKVVLTKCDLCPEFANFVARAKNVAFGIQVLAVNSHDPGALKELSDCLAPSLTGIFVGSSGVGKSTLANTLIGSRIQLTQEVRASDSKGRHTTASRALLRLPLGGLIVDVPGTRELAPATSVRALPRTFPDIEEKIGQCKFSNCQHISESGCKILEAIEMGEFDQRRFSNYLRLVD